jgi:CRP/FNR family transcriptional regulator, cyclic AMP receptor protein
VYFKNRRSLQLQGRGDIHGSFASGGTAAMTTTMAKSLSAVTAFRALDTPCLETIAPLFALRTFRRSQTVIAHNDASTDVYFVLEGALRATMFSPAGREISYQDLQGGDMFGELAAIDQLPRSTHVIALKDTRLAVINRHGFLELIEQYPVIAQATLQKMAGLVRFLSDRVYTFGALDVNHRIRAELARLAIPCEMQTARVGPRAQRATIPNMPTHQELANRLATHREAVSRELRCLEKSGLVEKQKHMLVITDFEKLHTMIWE